MTDSPKNTLPLLPLRDVVVFPHIVIPLFVGRAESIEALEFAMGSSKQVFLLAQKDEQVETPKPKDMYRVGTVVTILQRLQLPDGTVKLLVEGVSRAKCIKHRKKKGVRFVDLALLSEEPIEAEANLSPLMGAILSTFSDLLKVNKKLPVELMGSLETIKSPARLADSIAAHLSVNLPSRQKVLECINVSKRLNLLHELLHEEIELLEVEQRVQGRVKNQVEKSQRQYYLSEKIKAIQKELGTLDDFAPGDENEQLADRIEAAGMSEEAKAKALSELSKLKLMPPMSAESTVSRNYLDCLVDVPWKAMSAVMSDLEAAETVLDRDHYGLKEVKQRILEYLAVHKRVKKLKGPILCLVGPPGVGKTSLGQSIADATGREFVRFSLGGVRDEAEIRGHRRTYIGAMPGKIIQKMTKAKVCNPLFMLDEVDKMAMDFRGDPASALLEVLDPEQNNTFSDHYLEVDYDLSNVMFIATANSMDIPGPLLDRMEVIRLPGYTEQEKLHIAKRYLLPRQLEQNGLEPQEMSLSSGALQEIIRNYTREAGVRSLEREISKLCRKVVKALLSMPSSAIQAGKRISSRHLEKYLGVKPYRYGIADKHNRVGQVTGLAWTQVGGELLTIEAQVVPGRGKSLQTGCLGEVMQESIQAAMTVVRSRADTFALSRTYFQEQDFHIHVPEGATPKDGPSAGVGMCTALISAITQVPVCADVAMTGEITLRGDVLPIGGLKEKLLAALRGGIKRVVIPRDNERELVEFPKIITDSLDILPASTIEEVLAVALEPKSVAKKPSTKKKSQKKAPAKKLKQPVLPKKENSKLKKKKQTRKTKK